MAQKTIQIATFGERDKDAILVGIRNFPVHKLVLLCYEDEKAEAEEFANRLRSTLSIPIRSLTVSRNNLIHSVWERISEVMKIGSEEFDQILINESGGDRTIGCAAVCGAFVHGVKAFAIVQECPVLLPILKLSYNEVISAAKFGILKAIDNAGGSVESLEQLSNLSHFGKPLLSYHVQGTRDTNGLADLGLVEVDRVERGRISIKLTTMGKLLIGGSIT